MREGRSQTLQWKSCLKNFPLEREISEFLDPSMNQKLWGSAIPMYHHLCSNPALPNGKFFQKSAHKNPQKTRMETLPNRTVRSQTKEGQRNRILSDLSLQGKNLNLLEKELSLKLFQAYLEGSLIFKVKLQSSLSKHTEGRNVVWFWAKLALINLWKIWWNQENHRLQDLNESLLSCS